MVIRLILRYLANNDKLVERLSESYPMQKAARFVVQIFNRGKNLAEEQDLKGKLDSVKIKDFISRFATNVRTEIKSAKDELMKKK